MGRKLLNRDNKYPQPISQEGPKVIKLRFTPQPKSLAQELYLESLRQMPLTIGDGPAGSGK
jgi:phosphate starvation-inducible protein PhoH